MKTEKAPDLKMFDNAESLDLAMKYVVDQSLKACELVGVHAVVIPFGVFRNSAGGAGLRQSAQVITPTNFEMRKAVGRNLRKLSDVFLQENSALGL